MSLNNNFFYICSKVSVFNIRILIEKIYVKIENLTV